jgi:formamidopyrimidine-DNA glycosylase
MPELPEVEAARRGIAEQLLGRAVVRTDLRLPKLIVAPAGLHVTTLEGRVLDGVERHGKYLTLLFGDIAAVAHLKLSGQLVARGPTIPGFAAGHPVPAYDAPLPHKSTHLIATFDDDATLYLTDIRHFARVQILPADDLVSYRAGLRLGADTAGPEFTLDLFRERLGKRKQARLKPLLLDQTFVAGLGNIYVDEALHRARLHPERLAPTLREDEVARLFTAIGEILALAIPIGGARILNGKAATDVGEFPYVHGREGQPCTRCGTAIVKERVNLRGTYRCPQCQPAPVN